MTSDVLADAVEKMRGYVAEMPDGDTAPPEDKA
jgi:hypothetical protein